MMNKRKLLEKTKIQLRSSKRDKKKLILATIVLVILLLVCAQYVAIKYQMSVYDIHDYACVHMSYDAEKFFEEELGLHVVQRRVEHCHRWIAIEILPGIYIEYETTLRLFNHHLVTGEMMGEPIYQSEGFWVDGEQNVLVSTHDDIHVELEDWKEIGTETGPPNEDFWRNFP